MRDIKIQKIKNTSRFTFKMYVKNVSNFLKLKLLASSRTPSSLYSMSHIKNLALDDNVTII